MNILGIYSDSILLAVAAWVYVYILLKEGMILSWWWEIINELPEWASEPLGGCEYCVAGQMALWYYLYEKFYEYDLAEHILFITLTIFIVEIINKILKKN